MTVNLRDVVRSVSPADYAIIWDAIKNHLPEDARIIEVT
jgi:uncharacterized protein with HEPN domain